MAMPANEGGTGGKFRRRPVRRAAETPYDRPPTALRGVSGGGRVAEGGGWVSKLVDPASRLISRGASKLYASMFRKRLAVPPLRPDEDHQPKEDAFQPTSTIPPFEMQNCNRDGDNLTNNTDGGRIAELQTNTSEAGGITELEQLLMQKTFTRVEFDHLAELLRSRTVETSEAEPENNNEKKENVRVLAPEDGIGSSMVHEHLSLPTGSLTMPQQILKDEAASPAELAKAYMGSKPSKVSTSVGSLRNQVIREDVNLSSIRSTPKQLDLSVAPRSVIRFSGIPERPELGYQTAKTPGRSAIYRMSRSPYFKVNPTSNNQVGELSQWTPSAMKSGGKQVLKRGSAALDGDFGSSGPIRRIRQKSNLMSPSKETRSTLSGNLFSTPLTSLLRDVSNGSMLVQKPLLTDEQKYGSTSSKAENGSSSSIPLRSSETAQKLFQQLDKLLPSPKEKSSELRIIDRDEFPSKLTVDMLHGNALKSMEDLKSSNVFSMQGSSSLATASDSDRPNLRYSHSQKLDMSKESGPSKSIDLGVKLTPEANGVSNAPQLSKNAKHVVRSENVLVSSPALTVPKTAAFRISVPEDSLELDDDEYNTRDLSRPLTTINDNASTNISQHNDAISEAAISENPSTSTSQNMHVSSSISFANVNKKAHIQPVVAEKENGFVFPVASDPCTQSQPPPTPTMPTPQLDRPDTQKDNPTSPVFSFGSKDVNSSTVSSTTLSDTTGVKVREGSRTELASTTSGTTTTAEGSTIVNSDTKMAGDTFKYVGNTFSSGVSTSSAPTPAMFSSGVSTSSTPTPAIFSSGVSTSCTPIPAIFSFGASAAPSLSNSSLNSVSSTIPTSGTASLTVSEAPMSSIFGSGTSSSISSSVSSAPATFSTVPSFLFGAGISTSASLSVSNPLEKSGLTALEANSIKTFPFGMSNSSMAQGASPVFPSTGSSSSSDVTASVSIFSSVASSSAPLTSAMSSSMSSTPASSSLFSGTGSSVFGFGASTQPMGSSPSFAGISQNSSTAIFGSTWGSTTSSSSSFANNSSQSSTASIFGATNGSIFGTQPTQSGSGTSPISQNSTSPFGTFSSSPSLGSSNNSSSGNFGISPFGSATFGAQPFASRSGFSFSSGTGSSNTTGLFSTSSSSQASTSSMFASTTGSITSPATGLSFGSSASGSSSSPFTFSSSSGSSSSTFIFSASSGSSSSPLTFGSSSGSSSSPFTFGSTSSPAPAFGLQKPAIGFGSGSPGSDQMNVEDNMTDVPNPLVPTFVQPANPSPAPSFVFGSPAAQPGAVAGFQFGGHQNPSIPQNPSPFQSASNLEFTPGGSFSLGSNGGDKSGRKYVKVQRRPRKR